MTDVKPLTDEEPYGVSWLRNACTKAGKGSVKLDARGVWRSVYDLLSTISERDKTITELQGIEAENNELKNALFSAKWSLDGYEQIRAQALSGTLTCENVAKAYWDAEDSTYLYDVDSSYARVRLAECLRRARLDGALVFQARAESAEADNVRLREAIALFVAKYDLVSPAIDAAFAFQQNHGITYWGETIEHELADLRKAISQEPQS